MQRQQTRLLADFLQVVLDSVRSAGITDARLQLLSSVVMGLQPVLPPGSQLQHAQDNQLLLCCFALQLVVDSLSVPLQQTHDFHRKPEFNFTPDTHWAYGTNRFKSAMYTKLLQHAMQWLHLMGAGNGAQLEALVDNAAQPR